jgi:transcriptional regulator with XRE-family HTH domain
MGAREDARRQRARTREVRTAIGRDLLRLREDAALTQAAVARAAGISPGHLSGIEHGTSEASTAVLSAVADVLGADLAVRAYPTTGPKIHDRIQACMVEALLRVVRPRWQTFVEVPVLRPARGFVDVVLRDRASELYIATEVNSELRRLEQQLRWGQDKARSLPSADLWKHASSNAEVSQLLVLRSTRANRELAQPVPVTFSALYPARARDACDALTGGASWPGAAVIWMRVEGGVASLLDRPPRGVTLGR